MRWQGQGSRGHSTTHPSQSLTTSKGICPLTATWAFSAVYATGGFAHSPCLSLFRVHWKELMNHNSGSSWLIFTKKQLHSISFFSTSFLRHPMTQIPLLNLVILSIVEHWMLSVSVKSFPDTPAPGISLTCRQQSRVPHPFWIWYVHHSVVI